MEGLIWGMFSVNLKHDMSEMLKSLELLRTGSSSHGDKHLLMIQRFIPGGENEPWVSSTFRNGTRGRKGATSRGGKVVWSPCSTLVWTHS